MKNKDTAETYYIHIKLPPQILTLLLCAVVINKNLYSMLYLTARHTKENNKGLKGRFLKMINLAYVPIAFMPVYCATKAALHSLTLSLRHQLRNLPVTVFEIAPPSVNMELGHDRREDKTQLHGGLPISDFLAEAMNALAHDTLEATIAGAVNLRKRGEEMFGLINS
jgi:short-subunit dehydrogenase involved in D-alanine esterification of teichoic acids